MTPPVDERLTEIEDRLDKGSKRMQDLRDELAANSATTNEVRELLEAGKNGLKVLGWIGVGAKWIGAIAGALVALWSLIYAATHNGQLPK
jgi:hypothetical protein